MENMKNCLILINQNAGSSRKISFEKVEKKLGKDFAYTEITLPCTNIPPFNYYSSIAVCGGDGTLSNVMKDVHDKRIDVYYFPVGTLNDKAKANRHKKRDDFQNLIIGKIQPSSNTSNNPIQESDVKYASTKYDNSHLQIKTNGNIQNVNDCSYENQDVFTYVFACGSFTPIGYCSNVKTKKRYGILAYVANIIREYKPNRIHAKIEVGNKTFEDDFTLIMFLKSPRCFGFNFNKDFDAKSESGHLIAIRSPKHKNMLGYVEMFFPFFRVFFMGLKRQPHSKNIIFTKSNTFEITFDDNQVFCRDGEKHHVKKGSYKISFAKSKCNFHIINKF